MTDHTRLDATIKKTHSKTTVYFLPTVAKIQKKNGDRTLNAGLESKACERKTKGNGNKSKMKRETRKKNVKRVLPQGGNDKQKKRMNKREEMKGGSKRYDG